MILCSYLFILWKTVISRSIVEFNHRHLELGENLDISQCIEKKVVLLVSRRCLLQWHCNVSWHFWRLLDWTHLTYPIYILSYPNIRSLTPILQLSSLSHTCTLFLWHFWCCFPLGIPFLLQILVIFYFMFLVQDSPSWGCFLWVFSLHYALVRGVSMGA